MKINISIEATAEELREAMGLPDLKSFHEELVTDLQKQIKTAQDPKELMKIIFPAGNSLGKFLWDQTMKNINIIKSETPKKDKEEKKNEN